jgi:hypothetical protein
VYRSATTNTGSADIAEPGDEENIMEPAVVADYMCSLASSYGIECAVVPKPGKHDHSTAGVIFASALPWLAGKIGTPGVPKEFLPGAPSS